jgi:hypothetical protein
MSRRGFHGVVVDRQTAFLVARCIRWYRRTNSTLDRGIHPDTIKDLEAVAEELEEISKRRPEPHSEVAEVPSHLSLSEYVLGSDEVASSLGVSRRHVTGIAEELGGHQAGGRGGHWRFHPSLVERWRRERRGDGTQDDYGLGAG